MKMEKETFDVLVKQVKDAVIEDLTSIDPTRTILKARIWCGAEMMRISLISIACTISVHIWICFSGGLNRMLQNGSGSNVYA